MEGAQRAAFAEQAQRNASSDLIMMAGLIKGACLQGHVPALLVLLPCCVNSTCKVLCGGKILVV